MQYKHLTDLRNSTLDYKNAYLPTVPFLAGRPAFFLLMYNTFLLRPAMSLEIPCCVPFLSWLRLACMKMIKI